MSLITDAHLTALKAHADLVRDLQSDVNTKNSLSRAFRTLLEEPLLLRKYAPIMAETCAMSVAALDAVNGHRELGYAAKQKAGLRYEHSVPLTGVLFPILDDALHDFERARQVIIDLYRPVWVTREEDLLLAQSGLRSRMPDGWTPTDGPFARYDALGIEVNDYGLVLAA